MATKRRRKSNKKNKRAPKRGPLFSKMDMIVGPDGRLAEPHYAPERAHLYRARTLGRVIAGRLNPRAVRTRPWEGEDLLVEILYTTNRMIQVARSSLRPAVARAELMLREAPKGKTVVEPIIVSVEITEGVKMAVNTDNVDRSLVVWGLQGKRVVKGFGSKSVRTFGRIVLEKIIEDTLEAIS